MKLFITGSTGLLGTATVKMARERGHEVFALVRPSSKIPAEWGQDEHIQLVAGDLRNMPNLEDTLNQCEAVLHLAAAKSGDLHGQLQSGLMATEKLLQALSASSCHRLVLTSSFSVYEWSAIPQGSTVDETAPTIEKTDGRDDYALSKLWQEQYTQRYCNKENLELVVLRPGVIYDANNLWTARLGIAGSKVWIRTGGNAQVPLTHSLNCAKALVIAAESEQATGQIYNVVDDHPPTQRQYVKLLAEHRSVKPKVVPLPWWFVILMAKMADLTSRTLFKSRAKLPIFLRPAMMHALCKPLKYSNRKLKQIGWQPDPLLEKTLQESQGR